MDGGTVTSPISIRLRTALVALVLAVAALAGASTARADDVPPATRFAVGTPAMQVAQSIAVANWGTDPCGGQVAIEWGSDDANINARSYWANPVSSYDNPTLNVQCRIVFNATMTYTWPKFCTVLVHEYGHLAGHPHSVDGPDVMSPIYRAPLAACTVAEPGAAPPAPVVAPAPVVTAPVQAVATVPATQATPTPPAKHTRTRKARGTAARAARRTKTNAKARAASAPLRRFTDADSDRYLPIQTYWMTLRIPSW